MLTRLSVWSPAYYCALLLCAACLHTRLASAVNEEGKILLEWGASLIGTGRDNNTANWNALDETPCQWPGVTCNAMKHVKELYVSLFDGGQLSPQLGNLSHLEGLFLNSNHLTGPIPTSFGQLLNLSYLDLSSNQLSGPIPASLGQLLELSTLRLAGNKLSGPIPRTLGQLRKLTGLFLLQNALSGVIPPELGNCSSLIQLFLGHNNLEGEVPASLWSLGNLDDLSLEGNQLASLPPGISRLSESLGVLTLDSNRFSGDIPAELGQLHQLYDLALGDNRWSPGPLPVWLQKLPQLALVNLRNASIQKGGSIPDWSQFKASSAGFSLDLAYNPGLDAQAILTSLNGTALNYLDLSGCGLTGLVPQVLQNMSLLSELGLADNALMGPIPEWLPGATPRLRILRLGNNSLSGPIPDAVGQWGSVMRKLYLDHNQLSGSIPGSLVSQLTSLTTLWVNDNELTGNVPGLLLRDPAFNGRFEDNWFSTLEPVVDTNVSLAGNCYSYNYVSFYAGGANFTGQRTFEGGGNFTGQRTSEACDAKYNSPPPAPPAGPSPPPPGRLQASLPPPPSQNGGSGRPPPPSSGRPAVPQPPPPPGGSERALNPRVIAGVATGSGALLLTCCILLAVSWRRKRRGANDRVRPPVFSHKAVGPREFLPAELRDATADFSQANILGKGGGGTVYRGMLADGVLVAVKVLPAGDAGMQEFVTEVDLISTVHNRNIVRLQGFCTEEERYMLVYDLMPRGSLEDALFSPDKMLLLTWQQTCEIMRGTAAGLAYLHSACEHKIVHRDVKLGNILLEEDLQARIGDFGIAKQGEREDTHMETGSVRGTGAYIAPEYLLFGNLTEKGDVYSFGMTMLVAATLSKPHWPLQDPRGGQASIGLSEYVRFALTAKDARGAVAPSYREQCTEEEAADYFTIALHCLSHEPSARPHMVTVQQMLMGNIHVPPLGTDLKLLFGPADYSASQTPVLTSSTGATTPSTGAMTLTLPEAR